MSISCLSNSRRLSAALYVFPTAAKAAAASLSRIAGVARCGKELNADTLRTDRRQNETPIQGPPLEATCMDSEITASDEELLAYFRGIMLQKRIDRMDMIERMTHAAASLSGNTPEEELALFHAALRNNGFDFNKALISYLS